MLVQKRSCLSALLATPPFLISICTANSTSLYHCSRYTQNANLISTTANQASSHGVQTSIQGQVQERSSIATLPPRSLSWEDSIGSWSLVFKDWEAFLPSSSSSTAKAISDMYASIYKTLIHNRSEIRPAKVLSFTYGGLRFTFQAIERALPWGIIEGFLGIMNDFTRAGLTGLYTVAFYYVKGSIIWSTVVIILILLPLAREGVGQNMIA